MTALSETRSGNCTVISAKRFTAPSQTTYLLRARIPRPWRWDCSEWPGWVGCPATAREKLASIWAEEPSVEVSLNPYEIEPSSTDCLLLAGRDFTSSI